MSATTVTSEESTGVASMSSFLTLQGIYSKTKAVYCAYVPKSASGLIEGLATKLFAIAPAVASKTKAAYCAYVPKRTSSLIEGLVTKLISKYPAVAKAVTPKPSVECPKNNIPSDLGELDTFLESLLSAGDVKIGTMLSNTKSYFDATKKAAVARAENVKSSFETKVVDAKSYVFGRYNDVKPMVATKINEAKAVVVKRLEDPEVVKIIDRATPFYVTANEKLNRSTSFVEENMEPAKAVFADMCTSAKSAIAEQGVVGCAKASAEVCKTQTIASVEVLRAKGAVDGTRELGISMLTAVVAALDEHKTKTTPIKENVFKGEEEMEEVQFAAAADTEEEKFLDSSDEVS
mmetsp:Transcript_64857/g.127346  ORF Transcript_64857/g.127346 Transcript_64857/m.127346 type:complete len:348 (+) Transcript_64857:195-1238(+)